MDPVCTSIGLAIAVIGILCQNVPEMAGQHSRFKADQSRILFDLLESRLVRSRTTYELWLRDWWDGEQSHHDQYQNLWGSEGWVSVKRSQATIKLLIKNILKQLGQTADEEQKLDSHTQEATNTMTRSRMLREVALGIKTSPTDAQRFWGTLNTLPDQTKVFFRRIWWAVFKHEAVAGMAKQLEEEVLGLERYSKEAFILAGLHTDAAAVNSHIVTRTKSMIRMSRLASVLYSLCEAQAMPSQWTLHLGHPRGQPVRDVDHFWHFVGTARLRFCVRYSLGPHAHGRMKILEFRVLQHGREQTKKLSEIGIQHLLTDPQPVIHEGVLYSVRNIPIDPDSYTDHRLLKKEPIGDKDVAEVSLVTTIWFMLVLRAGWFAHLCACRIRWNMFRKIEGNGSLATAPAQTLAFHPREEHDPDHACNDLETNAEELELFGLTLGTMLLQRHLTATFTSSGQRVYHVAQIETPFPKEDLIDFVEDIVDDEVTDAFAWCLRQEPHTESSRRSPYSNSVQMVDHVLPRYIAYHTTHASAV